MPRVITRPATAFRSSTVSPLPPESDEISFGVGLNRQHPALSRLGIPEWLAEEFEIGLSTDLKCLTGRLVFPVRNARRRLVGYAGRWAGEPVPANRAAYRYHGGAEAELFNLHAVIALRSELPILLVTDPLELLHLRRYFESVVSLLGDDLNDVQLRRLRHHLPAHPIIVLCDETPAGRERRRELVRRLCPYHPVRAPEFLTDGRTVRSLTLAEMKGEL